MSPLHLASGSPSSTESNPIFAEDPAPLHLPSAALSAQAMLAASEVPQAAVLSCSRPLAAAADPPARLLSYPNFTRIRAPPSQSNLRHLANVRQAQALMLPSPAAPASCTDLPLQGAYVPGPTTAGAFSAPPAAASGSPAKSSRHLLVMPKVGVAWNLKSCDKPRHQQPLGPKSWQQPQPHLQPNQPMVHQPRQPQHPHQPQQPQAQHPMLHLPQGQPQSAMQQQLRPKQQQQRQSLLQVPLPTEKEDKEERKEVVGGASGASILGGRSPPLPPPPRPPPSKYPSGPRPKLTPFLLSAIANSKANASAASLVQNSPVTLPAVASVPVAPASLQPVTVSALTEVAAMPTLHLNAGVAGVLNLEEAPTASAPVQQAPDSAPQDAATAALPQQAPVSEPQEAVQHTTAPSPLKQAPSGTS
ncbi:unnamed protein product [Closterium sp. NIES-65]|nr:unnamed protein product [Closterium sp. NIES-65]